MNKITIELCAEDRARLDRLAEILERRIVQADTFLEAQEEDITEAEKPVAEEKPAITLAQIQQKVVQLSAANNGKHKAKVREIITAYSPTVSGLNDVTEAWPSIWESLLKLESETGA